MKYCIKLERLKKLNKNAYKKNSLILIDFYEENRKTKLSKSDYNWF